MVSRAAAFGVLSVSLGLAAHVGATPIRVEIAGAPGQWTLLRDGKPYFIRGAGGVASLKLLSELGGNSGRTWGADNIEKQLDEAQALGMSMTVGVWLEHPRHGFSYNDPERVSEQIEKVRSAILKYKDHPAVLAWGIGNEMEGEGNDAAVWSAINNIASMVKRLDPSHPTMTVIAELGEHKVRNIHRLCPDVDIIGLNTYGGGASIGDRYAKAGGTKPYIVTEFGPNGTWEQGRNEFGAPVELTSTQKAAAYRATYTGTVLAHPGSCLGSYAFLWGHKVEATLTWFGLLLPDEARLAGADTLSELWTGRAVANRCPTVEPIVLSPADHAGPGSVISAQLRCADPESDPLSVTWALHRELGRYETGGDAMAAPPEYPKAIVRSTGASAEIVLPDEPGVYRLYAYVRDNHGGGATASVPILSEGAASKVPSPPK